MLIGYARVSTADQCADLQLDALKAAGCERVFMEKASGASRDRSQLKAALRALKPGDSLVVWKLDRLARSIRQLIDTIERLEHRGVGFRSLTEAIDTTTSSGRLVFHIMAAMAEFERSIIRERTLAGLAAARERGRVGGRRRKLSDSEVLRARQALQRGARVSDVADQMGVASSTMYRIKKASDDFY